MTPKNPDAQARTGWRLTAIKQLERSCRRWQLYWLQLDLRGELHLDMHLGIRNPRQSQVAPGIVFKSSAMSIAVTAVTGHIGQRPR